MTATLTLALLLAFVGYCFIKPRPAHLLDGGALIVGIVFASLIGAADYENKVHDNKQLNQVGAFVDHQMCNRAKVPCTNPVPSKTDIRKAEGGGWIDNAGKTTWPVK